MDCLLFDECYSAIKSFIILLLMNDDFIESQMMTLNTSNQR